MSWKDRITLDPKVMTGKPIVRGTRITVELILELLAQGWTQERVITNYPQIDADDILAALAYARDSLKMERVYPIEA